MRRRWSAAVLLLLLALATGACGSSTPQAQVHASRAASYKSLRAAAHDAAAVVEIAVEATGTVQAVGSVPFTVTEGRVTEVLRGEHASPTVHLRQLGAVGPDGLLAEGELLRAGERYVAFVTPFVFGDGKATGQHVVVGTWQGLYRVEGTQLVATDRVPSELPKRLSRASLVSAIS